MFSLECFPGCQNTVEVELKIDKIYKKIQNSYSYKFYYP